MPYYLLNNKLMNHLRGCKMRFTLIALVLSSVLLTACGSDNVASGQVGRSSQSSSSLSSSSQSSVSSSTSSQSSSSLSSAVAVDYDKLESAPLSEKALILASEAALLEQIKNGIRLQLKNGYPYYLDTDLVDFSPAPPASPRPALNRDNNFSQTNVHVDGVDEADYAKYDGTHWFVSRFPEYRGYSEPGLPGIQVVKTNADTPSVEIVGEITFDDELWGTAAEMYLVQQAGVTTHLAAMRHQWGNVSLAMPGSPLMNVDFWFWPGPQNGQARIQLINVQDPTAPVDDWDIKIDGSLINSKKIGNILYLITRYDPWLEGLIHEFQDDSMREANETILAQASLVNLLPSFQIGETTQLLTTQCYLQEETKSHYGFNSLVHVTAIDLANKKLISSQCLNSGVETIHMSPAALYLTGTVYDDILEGSKTVIHKFSLKNTGPEYAATGDVPGYLWGGGDAEFRINEYQGDLRIVTSSWGNGPRHQLFVLEENNGELKTIARLPNAIHPEPIGKPNEQIYSVRFNGDSAYIVTFLQTDPLYSLDLSDRLEPKVAGQIEMPGFATYIHPIDDDYIFTVGRNANSDGQTQGVKVELIDVSANTPVILNTILLGGRFSNSEALYNLRALSFLRVSDDQLRITMPIELWLEDEVTSYYDNWQYNGLQLFEINGLNSAAVSMKDAGTIVTENAASGFEYPTSGYGINRSVLHNNAVFFSYNNDFWAADWNAPEQALGPISADPIICTEEYRFGLNVTVAIVDDNSQKACGATVIATDGSYQETLTILETGSDHCIFYGAGERSGAYSIETSLVGYESVMNEVEVFRNVCHVIPKALNVLLAPVN